MFDDNNHVRWQEISFLQALPRLTRLGDAALLLDIEVPLTVRRAKSLVSW